MELIETGVFTRQIAGMLSDEEYREFQSRLAENPELGARISGGGGIRKVRVAVGGRGKRGGARSHSEAGGGIGKDRQKGVPR